MRALLLALVLLLGGFVAAGFLLPREVTVERSIAIQRPPATVFTLLNGYHRFREWSPWAALDPDATWIVSGPERGAGARLEWSGDPTLVGSGAQEVVLSEPWRRIVTQVDFEGQGLARSTFEIAGDTLGSRLSWRYETDVTEGQDWLGGFLARYFALFLDDWIGADYERGLQRIKALAESLPAGDFSGAEIERVRAEPRDVLFLAGTVPPDPDAAARALEQAFLQVSEAIRRGGLAVAGPPMAISRRGADGSQRFEAAIPVSGRGGGTKAGDGVERGQSPAGDAVRIVHRGSYESLPDSYRLLEAWMGAQGLPAGDVSWEVYLSDPADTPPEQLETHVYARVAD